MTRRSLRAKFGPAVLTAGLAFLAAPCSPQGWGALPSRNMVSPARGLPAQLSLTPGKGLKWSVALGTQTYSSPVAARGRVLIGTNNERPRDERIAGDAGVLMCLDARDGSLVWQFVSPKIGGNPYDDWPGVGLPSPATVEGNRVYVLTNRNEVACLDIGGLADGNAGPFTGEARYRTRRDAGPVPTSDADADILWLYDIVAGCDTHRHDAAHGSVLPVGPFLYINTSSGVTDDHQLTPKPDAPAVIALRKADGALAARDRLRLGPVTIHNHWASPAYGTLAGRPTVLFGGGDGVCYGFAPPAGDARGADWTPLWRFDCDPTAPKSDVFKWQENRREGPSVIQAMPVVEAGLIYVIAGGDYWHGKPKSWLRCLAPTAVGTPTQRWVYEVPAHVTATPAVEGGLVYLVDAGGTIHCVDARTGRSLWTHALRQEVWASPLLADGKLYVVTRQGTVAVLAAGRSCRVLSTVTLDGPIHATPCADDGVLYVASMKQLYAFSRPPSQPGSGGPRASTSGASPPRRQGALRRPTPQEENRG